MNGGSVADDDSDTPPIDLSILHGTPAPVMPEIEPSTVETVQDEPTRGVSDFAAKAREYTTGKRAQKAAKPVKPSGPVPTMPRATNALIRPLEEFYTTVGTFMLPFDQPCGTAVINSAHQCAVSIDNLARENPKVRAAILRMVETSVWGAVIAAHAGIIMTIAQHHGPGSAKAPDHVPPEWEARA